MIILYIIFGVAAIFGIGAFIFSRESNPGDRAKEAAGAAVQGALGTAGCFLQMIFSAIPIAIAILIVIFVLRGC